jgi:cytochrome P450
MLVAVTDADTRAQTVPHLELFDPSFRFDDPSVFEAREANWYGTTPMGLIALRYADVHDMLRDRRFIQDGAPNLLLQGVTDGPLWDWFTEIILFTQGDAHTRLRRLVNRAFVPKAVDALRPAMREAADRLGDDLAEGSGDFIDTFADPYPVTIMGRLLGVPVDAYQQLRVWSSDIGLAFSLSVAQNRERIEAAVDGLHDYVDRLLCERRRTPGEDVVSALIAAEEEGERLSQQELRHLLVSLIFAGHDTTRNQLGNAMVAFSEAPEQWDRLARRPQLAENAVEEIMRFRPAVPAIFRFAAEDVVRHDLPIPAGTFVLQCVQTANRDPRVYADGDRFDIAVRREAPQLTFGGGMHFCLGAWVARAELAEALPILARRLRPPVLAAEPTWRPPVGIVGPERLPLHLEPR